MGPVFSKTRFPGHARYHELIVRPDYSGPVVFFAILGTGAAGLTRGTAIRELQHPGTKLPEYDVTCHVTNTSWQ